MRLWHAFNDDPVPEFVERGNVTVSSVRSGASVVGQNGLLPAQVNTLKNLAEHDGKYRLMARARTSSGSEYTFLTSVPAVVTYDYKYRYKPDITHVLFSFVFLF